MNIHVQFKLQFSFQDFPFLVSHDDHHCMSVKLEIEIISKEEISFLKAHNLRASPSVGSLLENITETHDVVDNAD